MTPPPQSVVTLERAEYERLIGVAEDLISNTQDPGTEALAAVYCARRILAAPAPSSLAGGASGRLSALLSSDHLRGDYPIAGLGAVSWNDLRAILAALSPEAPAREGAVFKHRKRGTEYTLIGGARLQAPASGLFDDAEVVVYQGADGDMWVRSNAEFWDGRFECVSVEALTPRHEAPAEDGPVFHMNLLSHEDNEAWLESARRVAAKHEAPAEGAGEMHSPDGPGGYEGDVFYGDPSDTTKATHRWLEGAWTKIEIVVNRALRARSSAPEAREGEALRECLHCGRLKVMGCRCDYPAAPSADKLRIALQSVQRMAGNSSFNINQNGVTLETGDLMRVFDDIERTALAALKAEAK